MIFTFTFTIYISVWLSSRDVRKYYLQKLYCIRACLEIVTWLVLLCSAILLRLYLSMSLCIHACTMAAHCGVQVSTCNIYQNADTRQKDGSWNQQLQSSLPLRQPVAFQVKTSQTPHKKTWQRVLRHRLVLYLSLKVVNIHRLTEKAQHDPVGGRWSASFCC